MTWFDPFSELEKMHEEMNKTFRRMFSSGSNLIGYDKDNKNLPDNFRAPLCDVYEKDGNVIAQIEVPGVDKKDIDVNVTDDSIELKVEKQSESEVKKKGMYRCERSYSGFYRSIPLPSQVKSDQAKAQYRDGVLKITAPKMEQIEEKKRKLQIE